MNFSIVSLLFFTLLAAPLTKCHSDYNKVVVKLTGSNFNELVLKNDVSLQLHGVINIPCVETSIG